MDYKNILIEEENGIVVVTINRPKALNALNSETIKEIGHYFGEVAPTQKDIKGVIITGAGEKAFVAGADIKEFLGIDAKRGAEISRFGQEAFFKIERLNKPVIAAVNGFALGGGCELAMACHMRIAGAKARFGQPEVNLGLIPGFGASQRLVQYIGKGKALELLLTADMIGAEEAERLGLVNKVVEVGTEVEAAKAMLKKIVTKGPLAVAKTIECVNAYFEEGVDGFEKEIEGFGFSTGTKDFVEGATAFVEKRKAEFKGE